MWRALAAAAVLGTWGCSGGPDASCADAVPAKLSDIQTAIFTPSCATAGCHTGGFAAQDLRLDPDFAYGALVNVHSTVHPEKLLVSPGDPSNSYLYSQVADGSMPQNAAQLTSAQLEQIRGWICAGAPND